MRYSRYILLLPLLVVLSCKKENDYDKWNCSGPRYNIPIDPGLFVYEYKEGTYWIFVDSTNTVIDSASVTYTGNAGMWNPCFSYDDYRFGVTSSPEGTTEYYDLRGYAILNTEKIIITYPGDYPSVHYDSLFILNQYYHNVTKGTASYYIAKGPGYTGVFYMNPEYGFLRMDMYDSLNVPIYKKFLLRSHIIR